MTIHQCPKCELRFSWNTELDDHCRTEHPGFRHEYPAHAVEAETPPAGAVVDAEARRADEAGRTSRIVATWWSER